MKLYLEIGLPNFVFDFSFLMFELSATRESCLEEMRLDFLQ